MNEYVSKDKGGGARDVVMCSQKPSRWPSPQLGSHTNPAPHLHTDAHANTGVIISVKKTFWSNFFPGFFLRCGVIRGRGGSDRGFGSL